MYNLAELIEKLSFSMQQHEAAVTARSEFRALTVLQIHYLDAIRHLKAPAVGELAHHFGVTKPTATVAIERLEARGFVKKVPSSVDRRVTNVHLTERGMRVSDLHDEIHEGYAKYFGKALKADELRVIVRLLNKVVCELEK